MTKPVIVTRESKGNALTWQEGDANFTNLRDATFGITDGTITIANDLNSAVTITSGTNVNVVLDSGTNTVTINSVPSIRTFNLFGTLVPTTGTVRWYPNSTINITSGYLTVGTSSPTDIVLRININNSIVGTFTLPANSFRSTTQTLSLTMLPTDYMTADLLTTGGENLTLTLEYNS